MLDRLATIRAAKACVSPVGASALPCDASRMRATDRAGAGAVYCGFTSSAAREWLARLRLATAHCALVAYTIVVGGYDGGLGPVPRCLQRSTCHIAFVDAPSRAAMAAGGTRTGGWALYDLPTPLPFPDSPQRLAHTFKIAASWLFPAAKFVIYLDGKIQLRKASELIARDVRNRTHLPYVVMEHPSQPNGPLAVEDEFEASQKRVNQTEVGAMHARDTADIAAQRALYASEGAFNRMFGMLDAQMLLQNRVGEVGSTDAAVVRRLHAPDVIRWLECVWFNEVVLFSHREQNSFWYAVDELGLRRQVYVVPTKSNRAMDRWTRRNIKQTSDFYVPSRWRHMNAGP
ncbi:hypothetical protein KFE25_007480 [Diacronema lutheri]|uniref:TOD1/MUCI70 glycosyltransferase-like domain-containing protein n=1 Tax=Diacronema lutheri TaxID=2081491 RepID=A0A8J5XV48_DIALT|nr:hypothetical protein KFE25_007480 [Diacronema lutheri]